MLTVRQILARKGTTVWSIAPGSSVFEAIERMAEKRIGALLVLEGDRLVGIISERDYARKVILQGRSSKETRVGEIMTREVLYVTPERTADECMALITEKRIRHLPVLEEGRLIGVLSSGDIIKAIISEQQFIMEQLETYIRRG